MGLNVTTFSNATKSVVQTVGNESAYGIIPITGAGQTVTPSVPMDNVSLVNCSNELLRVTISPTDAANFVGDGTFLVLGGGSLNWGYDDDELQVSAILVEPVEVPASTTAGAALTPKVSLTSEARFTVNFVNQ